MLRFHKSNACLSGKDALAAFFPGQTYATPAIQAAMRDCAARSALPLTILSGQYHQLRQVLRFMAEDEKSIGSGIALTHRREAAGLGARGTVSAAGEPDAVPKLRLVRPGIYSVLRRRPRKSLWSSDADETSFPAYRGGPVTEGAESGTLLFGDRSAGGAGHDVPGAGHPAELQRPQRSGEGIQACHPETETTPPRRSLRPVAGHPASTSGDAERCRAGDRLLHTAEDLERTEAILMR
mgnify:FL=1